MTTSTKIDDARVLVARLETVLEEQAGLLEDLGRSMDGRAASHLEERIEWLRREHAALLTEVVALVPPAARDPGSHEPDEPDEPDPDGMRR